MPEGDTIFRAARTMAQALVGQTVSRFDSAYAQLVHTDHPVDGRTIEAVRAAGKHLLIHFSGDLVLRTHMRMNGSWHLYRPGERWQRPRAAMRILIETPTFVAVGFDVPVAELLTGQQAARSRDLRRLGPDLLGESFDEKEAFRRLRAAAQRPLEEAVLDQGVMAGAGNVFKSEMLFLCGLAPFTPVAEVSDAGLRTLVSTARRLLRENVRDGKGDGIVTYHGLRRTTGRSDPTERLWVYGRAGRPCRKCAALIAVEARGLHARLTYFCPRCQTAERA